MICIVCVDNANGMMFNHRRQSRDNALIDNVISLADSARLFMNEYSAKLFGEKEISIISDEGYLEKAEQGDFCFVEDKNLLPYENKIEKIIVYKWNRAYPSDFKLNINLSEYALQESVDFEGSSHEKITREVYVR